MTGKGIKGLLLMVMYAGFLQAQDKPNILWIVTDDQRADALECYNLATRGERNSPLGYVESPNINALADEGVLFTRAYCNSPACAPSRTSFHYGQYPHHNGVYGFTQSHDEPDFVKQVVPKVLRNQGYRTAHFGKTGYYIFDWGPGQTYNSLNFYNLEVDHQRDLARKGFGDWSRYLNDATFWFSDGSSQTVSRDRTVNMTPAQIQERDELYARYDILRAHTRWADGLILGGVATRSKDETTDAFILKEFITYLEKANQDYSTLGGIQTMGADTTKPLMIHLGFHLPHTPVLPPASFRERFKDKVYNIPEFDRSEVDRLPAQMVKIYDQMKVDAFTYGEKQQMMQDYYAFCAFGDSLIGKAIAEFKTYSEARGQEYLIILATGDHGWHLGEQGISAKFAPWDYSNHTGVIVVSSDKSRFPAGTVNNDPVEYVDFAPTMYAAAGIDISTSAWDFLDGYDLAGVVDGSLVPREYVFGEMNAVCGPRAYLRGSEFAFSMRIRPNNGVTSPSNPPNNNIRWALDCSAANAEMALYDLRVDPKERRNVAYEADYVALAAWFRTKLGNIALGDGRVECSWEEQNNYAISNFAPGADDKRLDIPPDIIPDVSEYEEVELQIFKKREEQIIPARGVKITLQPTPLYTDSLGKASALLRQGQLNYSLSAPGLKNKTGSFVVEAGMPLVQDTMETDYYRLRLIFRTEQGNLPVKGIAVTLGDSTILSNENGIASFDSLLFGDYTVQIEVTDGFDPLEAVELSLSADKDITLFLTPRSYLQNLVIRNSWTAEALNGAIIEVNNEVYASDYYGKASLSLVPGEYSMKIRKDRFGTLDTLLSVEGEADHTFLLRQMLAEARFRVYYNSSPLAGVQILAGRDTLVSSAAGLATFRYLAAYTLLNLQAIKEGFADWNSSAILRADTLITLHMQLASFVTVPENHHLKVYPNPTEGFLHIDGLNSDVPLTVRDLTGRIRLFFSDRDENSSIDLSGLSTGTYILQAGHLSHLIIIY